jgi:hypothetical protein
VVTARSRRQVARIISTVHGEADACLIAAAPDLLAACEAALAKLGTQGYGDTELCKQLNDAIVSACGTLPRLPAVERPDGTEPPYHPCPACGLATKNGTAYCDKCDREGCDNLEGQAQ